MLSEQKIEEYRRNLSGVGWRQGLQKTQLLNQIQELVEDASPSAIAVLAVAIKSTNPSKVQQAAVQALDQFTTLSSEHLTQLCRVYCQTQDFILGNLIVKHEWLPIYPLELRVETALKTNLIKPLYDDGPEIVLALLRVVQGEDKTKRQLAETVLLNLTKSTAQDELCRLASENGQQEALRLALSAGYLPGEVGARSLFFFLNGQFDKYDELDFDQRRLKSYYETGNDGLRRRIAQKVREAGRVDYLDIIRTNPTHSENKAKTDWAVTIEVLKQQERWPELWALVKEAPPRWCKQILQDWPATAWQPDDPAFEHLCYLARQSGSVNVPLGHLHNPSYEVELFNYVNVPSHYDLFFSNKGWLVSSSRNSHSHEAILFKLNEESWPNERVQVSQTIALNTENLNSPNDWFDLVSTSAFQLLKARNGHVIAVFGLPEDNYKFYYPKTDYAVSPDGQKLIIKAGNLKLEHYELQLWNLTDNQLITKLQLPDSHKYFLKTYGLLHTGSFTFNQIGDQLFWDTNGRKIFHWNLPYPDGQPIIENKPGNWECRCIDPQGNRLVVGLGSGISDPRLVVFDVATSQNIATYNEPQLAEALVFSADGQTLIGAFCDEQEYQDEEDGEYVNQANHNLRLRNFSDEQVVTLPLNLGNWRSRVFEPILTEYGQLFVPYQHGYPEGQDQLRVYEFWLVDFIGREQAAITQAQWTRIETTLASGAEMLPSERHWLEFCEALLRWNRRHEIELDDKPPVTPQEFDIEL